MGLKLLSFLHSCSLVSYLSLILKNIKRKCIQRDSSVFQVYKLDDPSCPRPECYRSCGSSTPDEFLSDIPGTKGNFKLVR